MVFNGTSMATDHVNGLLVLLIQQGEAENGSTLTEEEIYALLGVPPTFQKFYTLKQNST